MTSSELVALSTRTFANVEYLLQILNCRNEVIVTVGEPMDMGCIKAFHIWKGEGTNEDGEESIPYVVITNHASKVGAETDDLNAAWRTSIREAYALALSIVLGDPTLDFKPMIFN
jgi:hypothetical protein